MRVRSEAQNICRQRNVMAGAANESLHRLDRAFETEENIIELFKQPKMESILLQPPGVELGNETNFDSAPFPPTIDAVEIKEIRRVHEDDNKRFEVFINLNSNNTRLHLT